MLSYINVDHLKVIGYSDADLGRYLDSRKFITGYVFLLAVGVISCISKKQSTTTAHTMEVEFIALYHMDQKLHYGLGVVDSIERPLKIFCDNEVVISLSNNNKGFTSCRHMELKYFVAKKMIENHLVCIDTIDTKEITVDPFTKGLALYFQYVMIMSLFDSF